MKCLVEIFDEQKRPVDLSRLASLAREVWLAEGKMDAVLNVVLMDDAALLALNKKFLGRDYLTDVIAFPISAATDDSFEGEIYLSIDRVFENADAFASSPQTELARILVHGVLHFLGYRDKSREEKEKMSMREDHYLKLAATEPAVLSRREP